MIDKNKDKWWEAFQYQCPKCRRYLCYKFLREDGGYYYKKCNKCGFENKKEIQFAEYKHENGKVFLRSNEFKEFTEVKLAEIEDNGYKYLKVVPVREMNNLKLL